ncbi:alpha/beta fold hydrolase [Roseateles chitinivorans]|uniref:alpha/beta fold hydrolase n=1 Tax=Roseateles chitinivorans TaxID=2917965 RepID=UPI003D67BE91
MIERITERRPERPTVGARLMKLLGFAVLATALLAMAFRAPERPLEGLVARWAPPPSDFLELKLPGGQIQLVHFRDEGPRSDTTPIVLLHGTAASLHTWEGWARSLSTTRRVVTLDLPGFGLTGPSVLGDYSDDAYDSFLLSFFRQLQIDRMVLGGNSMGGGLAWLYAARHPQQVAALVLVDAGGLDVRGEAVPDGFRVPDSRLLHWLAGVFLPRPLVDRSLREVYGDPSQVSAALVDRYFELTLREGNREALAQRLAQRAPGEHADLLSRIQAPTLILWGGKDRVIPPSPPNASTKPSHTAACRPSPDWGMSPRRRTPRPPSRRFTRFCTLLNPDGRRTCGIATIPPVRTISLRGGLEPPGGRNRMSISRVSAFSCSITRSLHATTTTDRPRRPGGLRPAGHRRRRARPGP